MHKKRKRAWGRGLTSESIPHQLHWSMVQRHILHQHRLALVQSSAWQQVNLKVAVTACTYL